MLNRLLHEAASKYIAEKLLECPAFHRFVAQTHPKVEELQQLGEHTLEQLKHTEAGQRIQDFTQAFKENLEDELRRLR
jgi:hypothetical protein